MTLSRVWKIATISTQSEKNQPHFFFEASRERAKRPHNVCFPCEKSNFLLSLPFMIFNAIFLLDFFPPRRYFFRSLSLSRIRFVFISRYNSITWNIYLRDMKQLFFSLSLRIHARWCFFSFVLWWLLLMRSVNVSDEMLSPNERI